MARRPSPKKKAGAPKKAGARGKRTSAKTGKPVRKGPSARKGQWVYAFGGGKAEGRADMRELLGGKGANLAEMANLGLPVPPGFTITTAVCTHYYANAEKYPAELGRQVDAGLAHIARITGKRFGDRANPLLVSVRSGGAPRCPA